MKFSIYTGNHQNSLGISDTVLLMQRALRDSGHDAQINASVVPGRFNIVMEHFVDDASLRSVFDGHAAGARFVLVGTEPISGGTFNGGVVKSHWHYSNIPYWKQRYEAFLHVAQLADAVWVLAESMVESYRAVLPGKPIVFLPHGHVEGFQRFEHRCEAEKDIDFYFSGTLTEHRRSIVECLAQTHHVVVDNHSTPDFLRFEHLSRSKVCLSLRLSPENAIPSVSRMHFHLQHANYLIHEQYALRCALDPYVLHVPPDEFVEWARAALEVRDRRAIAESVRAKFKAEMSMACLMPAVLEASDLFGRAGSRAVRFALAA
jgi:hypothetical protein